MSRGLLISLSVAAVVVLALYWVMAEIVRPPGPRADYTITLCFNCAGEQVTIRAAGPSGGPDMPLPDGDGWLDIEEGIEKFPPKTTPSDPIEPQPMPREAMKPPSRRLDNLSLHGPLGRRDRCGNYYEPSIDPPVPEHPRDGDYAIVEFTIDADGCVRDIRVVESSNPKIHDYILGWAGRWKYRSTGVERRGVRARLEFEGGQGGRQ